MKRRWEVNKEWQVADNQPHGTWWPRRCLSLSRTRSIYECLTNWLSFFLLALPTRLVQLRKQSKGIFISRVEEKQERSERLVTRSCATVYVDEESVSREVGWPCLKVKTWLVWLIRWTTGGCRTLVRINVVGPAACMCLLSRTSF
jgi:hypothetical protein